MNYPECLAHLEALGHELRGVKFDLESIRVIMKELGHPETRYPTAIVAGTNGKGSTSAMLASILEEAGYRTGLYTSPHLVRVNERIRVGGKDIGDDDFARSFSEVRAAVDRLVARGALSRTCSFFEFLTATAFVHFARAPVDFVVLEVGMGGRLDATNITTPRVAVITNVELDHTQFLGETREAIAQEKAGVMRSGRPVISGCDREDAQVVIRRKAGQLGAELIELATLARTENVSHREGRYAFDLAVNGHRLSTLAPPLAGRFQVYNAAAAVVAAWRLGQEGLHIPSEAIRTGLSRTRWPGRLEPLMLRPLVLLDGAHNPAAAEELAAFVKEHLAGRRLRLVYASMRDKAIGEITSLLFPLATTVYLTRTEQARAAAPEEIQRLAIAAERSHPILEPDPVCALKRAISESADDDVVLAAGSLYLVGAIKRAASEGRLA